MGLLGGGIDNGVDFGDEEVEDSGVDDILDEEVAFGAVEVELVGSEAAHGNCPFVEGLVGVWLLPSLWSSPWSRIVIDRCDKHSKPGGSIDLSAVEGPEGYRHS